MLRIEAGSTRRYCDGLSRRSFVQIGLAGMAAWSLPDILRAKEQAAIDRKDTSVILIWLDGGPSHMDMYDMKPEAPREYRGIWTPIKTNVPGIEITELYQQQAKIADKFAILRSIHHPTGDHFTGAHYMLTGRSGGVSGADTPGRSPSIGSIIAKSVGARKQGMPPYVAVPYAMSVGLRPGYFAGNYIGRDYDPFETEGDPNADNFQVNNLNLAGNLTLERMADRRTLLSDFDKLRRDMDARGSIASMDRFQQQAYNLVTGPEARKAFDMSSEDVKVREQYGRNTFGQSLLLARRLVEAGSTFVTVHSGGWDHHWDLKASYERLLPPLDQAVATLISDLANRGTLDKTLVLMCGEFGRTPRMNDGGNGGPPMSMGTPGRDHWGQAGFCLVAGGGTKGGRIVGSTNRLGEAPVDNPVTPGDLHATIYHVLGIDPYQYFTNFAGRPVAAIDEGRVISELF